MSKLLFLFNDCEKKVVRVSEKGFEKTCLAYGVAPCRIAKLNCLSQRVCKNSLIYIEKQVGAFLYEVKVDDTIRNVCSRFAISEDQLCSYNQITYLYPYQIIEIPKGEYKINDFNGDKNDIIN